MSGAHGRGQIMKDVFTNALQKLAAVDTTAPLQVEPDPVESLIVQATVVETGAQEAVGEITLPLVAKVDPKPVVETAEVETSRPPEPVLKVSASISEPAETPDVASIVSPAPVSTSNAFVAAPEPSAWQRAASAVLSNRRQTAAVIVLLCMGYLWFDDSSTAPANNWTGDTDIDFSDIDSMASAFDSVGDGPTREPAEPQEQASADFQLAIPPGPNEAFPAFGNSSPSSSAMAVYPEDAGTPSNSLDGNFSIPNTTQTSSNQTQPDSGKRVRFTGGIQRAY